MMRTGFRGLGLGFRVWGLGFRVKGLGFRVLGLGFRVCYTLKVYSGTPNSGSCLGPYSNFEGKDPFLILFRRSQGHRI